MAFVAYTNPGIYDALFGSDEGCGCTGSSSTSTDHGCKECSCCPPGLVEQRDSEGKILACLTPNDALGYMINTYRCPDNKVKVIDATGNFIGCLSVDQYVEWLAVQV